MEDIENRAGERGEERIKKGKRHKWIHLCLLLTKKTDTRYRVSVLEKQERQKWIHLCLLLMKKTDARYRVSVLRNLKASYYMSELEYEHCTSRFVARTSQRAFMQVHDLSAESQADA